MLKVATLLLVQSAVTVVHLIILWMEQTWTVSVKVGICDQLWQHIQGASYFHGFCYVDGGVTAKKKARWTKIC